MRRPWSGATTSVTVDNAAPTVTLTASGNGAYAKYKAGTFTYTAVFTEAMYTTTAPTLTIGSTTAISGTLTDTSTDKKTFTYSFVVPAYATKAYDGATAYTVTMVGTDLAGNSIGGYSGNSIYLDNTAPTVVYGSYKSSEGTYTAYAKATDTITLKYTPTDLGGLVSTSATVYGATTSLSSGVTSGTEYTAMSGAVASGATAGSAQYSVTVIDEAGNTYSVSNQTSAGSSTVTIDCDAPTPTFTNFYSSNTRTTSDYAISTDTVYLKFTIIDGGAGLNGVASDASAVMYASNQSTDLGASLAYSSGTYTAGCTAGSVSGTIYYKVTTTDKIGNSATTTITNTAASKTVTVDNAAPTVTLTASGNGAYAKYKAGHSRTRRCLPRRCTRRPRRR